MFVPSHPIFAPFRVHVLATFGIFLCSRSCNTVVVHIASSLPASPSQARTCAVQILGVVASLGAVTPSPNVFVPLLAFPSLYTKNPSLSMLTGSCNPVIVVSRTSLGQPYSKRC